MGGPRVIVGIGNPGPAYAATRHNVGWRVLDRIACDEHLAFRRRGDLTEIAEGRVAGRRVLLVKPLTYVNLTGKIAAPLGDAVGEPGGTLMVVCDDLNLPLGALRVRPKGGAGGHKGLASLIDALGTREFARLRVGVGRPGLRAHSWSEYVLSQFEPEEEPVVQRAVERAGEALRLWLSRGLEACMNFANGPQEEQP